MTDAALSTITAWWEETARDLPWRSSRDDYAIWVSEVMSAQTSVARAAEAWTRWMARWPTVDALAEASLADVLSEWQGLGYPRRARDLHRSAQRIAVDGWPEDLTELPGVGTYVAAAIRCFAREQPVLPLDVNVRRVLARRFPDGVEVDADPWRAGQALMEFGQRVCVARPRCDECPARAGCPALAMAGGGTSAGAGARRRDARQGSGGHDPAPRARRQAPYRGSLREARGQLLRRVLTEREVALADADPRAAAGLVDDGLLALCGDLLTVAG